MSQVLCQKAGYYVVVSSWENDADHPDTVTYPVQSLDDAQNHVDFALLFRSKSRHADGIGNYYEDDKYAVVGAFIDFYNTHPDFFENWKPIDEDTDYDELDWLVDECLDLASDLGLAGGDFYTRVCESVQIRYFPTDVYYVLVSEVSGRS